jgi:hypothetical protein
MNPRLKEDERLLITKLMGIEDKGGIIYLVTLDFAA